MDTLNTRFHSTPERYREYTVHALDKAMSDGVIVQDDRDLICKFISHIESNAEHLSPGRQFKLANVLALSRNFLKSPFREATLEELETAAATIKSTTKYKRNTKIDYVRFLRRFFLWLSEEGLTDIPEKKIRAIKVPRLDNVTKTAEGMLTESEVKAIIENCKNSRDRLIVMLAYEGGFRIGELGSLTWGQIKEEPWGLLVNVASKTEMPRLVPCIHSKPYLAAYKNDTGVPAQPKRDDLVFWIQKKGTRVGIQYHMIRKMIRLAAEAADVEKRVTPHIFRHSAVTQAVNDGMSEQVVKSIFWGNAGTGMLRTYSHLSNKDIVNAVRQRYGIEKEPERKREMKTFGSVQCGACGFVNPPTLRFCGQCGTPLNKDARQSIQTATTAITTAITPEQKKQVLSGMTKDELMGLLSEIAQK